MNQRVLDQWRALLASIQFLTIFPVPRHNASSAHVQGASLLWYPVVGLLLGVLLGWAVSLLAGPVLLQAALIVTLWVVFTGGLHLDGLADCADAWLGGLGDREKTLRLLKDPLAGSMAVIVLVLVLVLKIAAVHAIITSHSQAALWSVPLLARGSLLLLFLSTDYVRVEGLGEVLAKHFSRIRAWCAVLLIPAALLFFLPLQQWLIVIAVALLVLFVLRRATLRRLGGFTGDVAGALVELTELGLLLCLALTTAA